MADHKKVRIGKILKPHGLKGELKIAGYTDEPDRFTSYRFFYLGIDRSGKFEHSPYEIVSLRTSGRFFLLRLAGIETIEQAQSVAGVSLFVDRSDALNDEGGVLIDDFIGLDVYDLKGSSYLGTIDAYYEAGSNGVFSVVKDQKDVLVPCDSEMWGTPDLEHKRITLNDPEGFYIVL